MEILTPKLPAQSALWSDFKTGDFLDCFAVESHLSPRPAAEVLATFPGWAARLLALRNLLVRPFGLKAEANDGTPRIGFFPIVAESDREVILGFDDRHLNFRIAVLSDRGLIHAATWVHPHNLGGKLYLAAVLPFHKLILRDAMRRLMHA